MAPQLPEVIGRADARAEREAGGDRAGDVRLRARHRLRNVAPRASRLASAEASVQPVPWVCRLSSRAAG